VLQEDVKYALAAGCTAHLGKPVKKQVLLDAVRTAQIMPLRSPQRITIGGAAFPAVEHTPDSPG
jgi:CheY-like chemotaxis protein